MIFAHSLLLYISYIFVVYSILTDIGRLMNRLTIETQKLRLRFLKIKRKIYNVYQFKNNIKYY